MARLQPAQENEDLNKPSFINAGALQLPEVALDLLDQEQCRIFSRRPALLDPTSIQPSRPVLDPATAAIIEEPRDCEADIAKTSLSPSAAQRLMALQERPAHLTTLSQTVVELAQAIDAFQKIHGSESGSHAIGTAAQTKLQTLAEELLEEKSGDVALVGQLATSGLAGMEKIRKFFTQQNIEKSPELLRSLQDLLISYERLVCTISRIAALSVRQK